MERIRVIDAAKMVLDFTGQKVEIKLLRDMPTRSAEPRRG